MGSFIIGAIVLLVLASLLAFLATKLTGKGADAGVGFFALALIGSILGHVVLGGFGPHILEIYLIPATLGAIVLMILGPGALALISNV